MISSHCYSKTIRIPEGAVLHYFSAIFADPDKWSDKNRLIELLEDMNRPESERKYAFSGLRKERYYASYDQMILPDGEIVQLVPDNHKTYHAGKSMYRGRNDCNSFMSGVALIAAPQMSKEYGFTENQYESSAELTKEFPIHMLTEHSRVRREYIDNNPNDSVSIKKDPGPTWSWDKFGKYRFGL